MAFEFRQVVERPETAFDLFLRIVEKCQREIEDATGDTLAVDGYVFLVRDASRAGGSAAWLSSR